MLLNPGIAIVAQKLQEAATAMSHEDVRTRLRNGLADAYPRTDGNYFYCYVVAVFGDDKSGDLVYSCNDELRKASYTISGANCSIKADSSVEVAPLTTYEVVTEMDATEAGARNSKRDLKQLQTIHDHSIALGAECMKTEAAKTEKEDSILIESCAAAEILRISEAAGELNPLVKIISPGRGSTGYYTEELLKRDGPKIFKRGTLMYINHATAAEEAARPEGDWSKLAAVTTGDAYWDANGKDGAALYAPSKVFSNVAAEVREKAPYTGVSIRAAGLYAEAVSGEAKKGLKFGESKLAPDGKPGLIGALTRADSIDLVTKAGRDGKLLLESAIAENHNEGGEVDMTDAEVKKLQESVAAQAGEIRKLRERAAIADAAGVVAKYFGTVNIAEGIRERVTKRILAGTIPLTEAGDLDEAKLTKLTEAEALDEAKYIENLTGRRIVTGMGTPSVEATADELKAAETQRQEERSDFAETMGFGDSKTMGNRIMREGRKVFDIDYNPGKRADGSTVGMKTEDAA